MGCQGHESRMGQSLPISWGMYVTHIPKGDLAPA